jgi:hypothetical protein
MRRSRSNSGIGIAPVLVEGRKSPLEALQWQPWQDWDRDDTN